MKTETREILIGAGAFGCLVLVFAYLYGGRDWAATATDGTLITAKFNRIDGLIQGDTVQMGGIPIGTVAAMALDSQYRAVVTMRVDDEVRLPTDTSAAIHTDGLFGSKFMVLEPGGEETYMKSGDEITFTQDAVVVGELLELIIAEGRAAVKERQRQAK